MRAEFAHEQAQTYLRQRNRFAVLAGVLGLTTLVSLGAAVTRDEQVVLVPITAERITVSSGGIDAPYLELVTRDTALMLLNRAPESLDYWMANILKLADPAAHGRLKAELVRIVEEQRGSDISQAFVIAEMHVDPSREGSLVSQALLAGIVGGFGRGFSANANGIFTGQVGANGQREALSPTDILAGGFGQGAGEAADTVSRYLIERAEQYQPVVEMPTGIEVEIVFLDGVHVRSPSK